MRNVEARGLGRLLRLILLGGALAGAAAGQYWLTLHHDGTRSALAWAAAALCFLLHYALARDARALPTPGQERLPRGQEALWLALVLGIGAFFVCFRIQEFPPGLNHDAAWEGLYALRILNGEPYTPYTNEAWGRETLTFYLRAASIWLMGPSVRAVQAPAMLFGFLTLPFFYFWNRHLFGARFALLATLLLGVSGWHLVFSRTGWRSDFQPFFMAFTCFFFIRGMVTARAIDFALSGVGLALCVNVYNGARVFPALFPAWLALVAVGSWHWRGFLRRYGWGLASMAVSFAAVVAPLAWYALNHWSSFQGRATALAGASTLADALRATVLLFNYSGNGDDFFVRDPALEYPPAVLLGLGLLWCLLKWRDERALFLLLGLGINLVPGLVSAPNLNRNIGTMIFIFPLIGLGALYFAREIGRLVPRAGWAAAVTFLLVVGVASTYASYEQYLSHDRRNVWGYYPETTVLGRYVKEIAPDHTVWVGGANFPRDAITYLSYQGSGNPMQRRYTWVDDVRQLTRQRLRGAMGKGFAFVLANEGAGAQTLRALQQRFPEHTVTDLFYPPDSGRPFARAVLVPAHATAEEKQARVDPDAVAVPPEAPPGVLRQPRGLAVTESGLVYVADFGNHRIQRFDVDLAFAGQWGRLGNRPGEFREPCAVAIGPQGKVFVADTWNQRIQVFTPQGKFLHQWRAGLFGPRGVAVDREGRVFVTDTGNNRIVRFARSGQRDLEWGTKGTAAGEFLEPIGIAVDPSGHVHVADNGNARVQIFAADGTFLSSFPVPGWKSAAFSEPHLAFDAKGRIWVTVPLQKEVRTYDRAGKVLATFGPDVLAQGTVSMPMGLAFSAHSGQLVVSDIGGRLFVLTTQE